MWQIYNYSWFSITFPFVVFHIESVFFAICFFPGPPWFRLNPHSLLVFSQVELCVCGGGGSASAWVETVPNITVQTTRCGGPCSKGHVKINSIIFRVYFYWQKWNTVVFLWAEWACCYSHQELVFSVKAAILDHLVFPLADRRKTEYLFNEQ